MKAILLSGAITTFASLLLFSTAPSASAAQTQDLHGHVPAAVRTLLATGNLAGTNRLQLAIALPLRNQAALSNLLQRLYDPASPDYHHYLTPQEFTRQFGPSEQDYQAVIAFAKANGLTVTTTHPNRVLLDVSGSVADVERALHVTMHTYRHPTENRTFFAPDTEPSLDLSVPILHISGLNNYSLPHPRLKSIQPANGQNASPNAGSGPGGSFMGKDFRAAYTPGVMLNGTGQTVGLLQFDGYTASDITDYENLAGLPNVPLQNVLIDGATGLPSGSGGEIEVSLDIEMAISMATNLSQVIVYMAPNPSPFVDLLSRMANDNLARQLSCSWFVPNGPAEPAADVIFQQMAAQGQSFFNASGDSDAYTGLIDFPGDTPYITQVGGTTLTTSGPGGSWVSETVWNWGIEYGRDGIGSGGGISTQYAIPSWQTNISMAANQGSTTMIVLVPPAITVPPGGRTNVAGATVTFFSSASESFPLSYQWQKNGVNLTDTGNVSGSGATNLSLSNVQDADTAGYAMVVTNVAGSITSSPAMLVVLDPPSILLQPTNLSILRSSNATFNVSAGGSTPFSYQWNFNGTNIIAATNNSLDLTNVQLNQTGNYAVLVTNVAGSVMSSNAVLVINPLFHFVWNAIPSPRFVGAPFAVTVQARNPTNGLATNFTDMVIFLSTNGLPVNPAVSGNFIQGVWTGAVAVAQTYTNLVLEAADSFGETGLANPINVVALPPLSTSPSGGTFYIFWPVNPSGFVLETTTGLSPANWVPVGAPPVKIGDQYFQPVQMSGTNAFFRLRFTGQ